MLDYSINEFVIINSLYIYIYFFFLFKGRFFFFKGLGSSHSNLRIEWKKKKIIHLRFIGINHTLSSHIPKNLKRFSMKPNIRITTFLVIQITKNHILKNLDANSNVDSPTKCHINVVGDLCNKVNVNNCFLFLAS